MSVLWRESRKRWVAEYHVDGQKRRMHFKTREEAEAHYAARPLSKKSAPQHNLESENPARDIARRQKWMNSCYLVLYEQDFDSLGWRQCAVPADG